MDARIMMIGMEGFGLRHFPVVLSKIFVVSYSIAFYGKERSKSAEASLLNCTVSGWKARTWLVSPIMILIAT